MKRILHQTLLILIVLILTAAVFSGCQVSSGDISLSETALSLTVGDSVSLSAVDSKNGAALKKLTWTSSDSNVVSVEEGTVHAKKAGSAVVTVTAENGNSKACNITVSEKEIASLQLNNQTAGIYVGKTIQLTATFTPADATDTALSWSSSDSTVALVNSEGYVTGVSVGAANIICKAKNNVEASCTVTVKEDPEQATQDKKTDDNNGGSNTTIIYYGHFNPAYVYNTSDFVFPDSSVRKLTDSEVRATLNALSGYSVSDSFAQDAINEIYARNGYIFKTDYIRKYYESKPWYYEDAGFSTGDFNEIERYNIDLLSKYS